jgi:hypothetical protein
VTAPVLSSESAKIRLDRTFSKTVETHWNLSKTGTPYKIKVRFTIDSGGAVKIRRMQNVLKTTDPNDEWSGIDPLVNGSIYTAITHGSLEYSVNGHQKGGSYIGWFITGPIYPHKVRILQESSN